ncbi:hypothetical protein Mal4_05470 [Maioricimonas rarisocia]|uniref:Uncharacterized protein n=1 Tax=Maioricimonas rarisocia TaxID=2528026 RepID=A0A517Z1B6_9PLAN|nr:hypothetical protein [Maioricimonas rarisocia]QDU36263.1 hypothetical protein Mal4_05470 [Maioricimonas rarisocia]
MQNRQRQLDTWILLIAILCIAPVLVHELGLTGSSEAPDLPAPPTGSSSASPVAPTTAAPIEPQEAIPTLKEPIPAPFEAGTVHIGPLASLGGRRLFPDDNPWNQEIADEPVDPLSDILIETIGPERNLHPDFGSGLYDGGRIGIPYIVVPGDQPRVPVHFTQFEGESDPGPYPIPPRAPIEGMPRGEGDRHVIVIDRDAWVLYELVHAFAAPEGKRWWADGGAVFDLATNDLRPEGWTSADAAGLPIFPGLVRYDEVVEQGEIRHALRFTCPDTRRAYVWPARHWASRDSSPALPPMGMRVRLKASVDIDGYPAEAQVILRALQRYGMFLADNGGSWFLSGTPDPRWDNEALSSLKQIRGSDFEVVLMRGLVTE